MPTDLAGSRARRKSWFGDLGGGDAALTGSGGKSGEGAQPQLQNGSNPNSRVRRDSLVADVDNLQWGEAATKRLKEQVEVSVMYTRVQKRNPSPIFQVMQKPSREAQKSFTWDATVGPRISVDGNGGQLPRK